VLDFHLLRSLKLQGSAGEQDVVAEQVAAEADQAIAQEHGIAVEVADVKRLDCLATTYELFAVAFKHFVDVVAKLALTSTALAAPAIAYS